MVGEIAVGALAAVVIAVVSWRTARSPLGTLRHVLDRARDARRWHADHPRAARLAIDGVGRLARLDVGPDPSRRRQADRACGESDDRRDRGSRRADADAAATADDDAADRAERPGLAPLITSS